MTPLPRSEVDSLAFGVRTFAAAVTVALGLFDIVGSYNVFLFRTVFMDALPGLPLPFPTNLIIRFCVACLLISVTLPIAAVLVAFLVRSHRKALLGISFLIVLIGFQTGVTWVNLLAPMSYMSVGVSSPH
jgi:hypothetical protein